MIGTATIKLPYGQSMRNFIEEAARKKIMLKFTQ
jgi:hypothetical protein